MPFTEKGKASFSESDGVTILMKVLQESDDEEFVDLIFDIFSSVIVDGKLVLIINKLNVNFKFQRCCGKRACRSGERSKSSFLDSIQCTEYIFSISFRKQGDEKKQNNLLTLIIKM